MEGVIAAAREDATHEPVAIVCNELTPKTQSRPDRGVLTAVIATPTALLGDQNPRGDGAGDRDAVRRAARADSRPFRSLRFDQYLTSVRQRRRADIERPRRFILKIPKMKFFAINILFLIVLDDCRGLMMGRIS